MSIAFTFTGTVPAFGMRPETVEGARLEELASRFPDTPRSKSVAAAAELEPPPTAGLEEVEQAMGRWFGPESTRADEEKLEEFLAARGEAAMDQFVRWIEEDRGLPPGSLGPWRIPPFDRKEIPAAGQFSAGLPIPSTPEAFEAERMRLMAEVAVQRALGRQIVVNVGIGFVGATVMIANSQGRIDLPVQTFSKPLQFRTPLQGKGQSPYFVVGFQRPSTESYFKIEYVNQGRAPITTADRSIGQKLKSARRRGNIRATFLKEAVAVADIALVDTELHVRKLVPKHLELSRADPGPTLKLLRQVGALIPKETLVIVETTVYPGFTLYDALPVLNEALRERGLLNEDEDARLAYTFQRVEPGPRLFKSLMTLERVGAGVTEDAREGLRRYYETVGFNYRVWDELTAVELLKDVENAYRFGLIELMGAFLRGAEIAGVNAFEVIEAVAQARPKTHGTIRFAPALQVGGYCIPKELVMVMWGLQSHFGLSELRMKEIFFTRLSAAVASDFRAQQAVYRLLESLGETGLTMEEGTILWLGLAYNPGVADTRYSGTERGLRLAAHYGARNEVTDPYVRHWPEVQQQRLGDPESWGYGLLHQEQLIGIRVQTTENPYETMRPDQDALVLATRHPQYVGVGNPDELRSFGAGSSKRVYPGLDPVKVAARMMGLEGKVILDSFDFLSDQDIRTFLALGWKVRGFGKGQIDRLAKEITVTEKREAVSRLLHDLVQLNGTPGISKEDLEAALQTTSARLEYLAALESNPEKNPKVQWAQARYELAKAKQEARMAKPTQRSLAEAKIQWTQSQVTFFSALVVGAPRARLNELEGAVDLAYQEVQQLSDRQRKTVLESARKVLIQPAQGNLEAILRRAAELIQAFRLVDQNRTLVPPDSVSGAVQMAESFLYLRDRVEDLSLDLDRAFEELVTPEGKALAATAVRKAQALPETAFPTQEVAVVYAQGEDGKLRRRVDPEGYPNRLSVKTVKDMAKGKAAIPRGTGEGAGDWSKYARVVPLNLVPADGIEFEAYPDFQGVPWEFRQWLLQEVLGKGFVLSTMDGIPQDRFGYAMDVNLDPKTVARGRGGILFFADTRQPLALTTEEGDELIVDLKAVGPYGGGDPASLGFNFERVTSTGMVAGGGVGRMQVGQVPGHMTSAEEIPRLHRLMRTEEAHQGKTPRPLFRVKWRYRGVPDIQFQMIARASPTNQRIGQIFIGGKEDFKPAWVARIMGENAARVLTQPIAGVHEGLNGDNIMANGHYTDLAGLIDLFNERNPYGAFYKYFGFYLQLVIYSFGEISRNDYTHPDTRYVPDWLKGFLDRFLTAGRGSQVRNPGRFRPFYQWEDAPAKPTALIEKLIRTIWENYLPYVLLKNRLEIGYDPTEESIYSTGDAKTLFHPESASAALEFIENQRQLLTMAERLIREEGYDPLPFDFPAAFQELEAKAKRIEEIAAAGPLETQPAYAEIYRLSFYPPRVPEVYPILSDVESILRGEAAVRLIQKVAEPTVFFDKSDVTAQAQLAVRKALEAGRAGGRQPAGLEELRKTYDRIAPAYAQRWGAEAEAQEVAAHRETFLTLLPREGVIIDAGTTGRDVEAFKAKAEDRLVIGIDFSEGMLSEARQRHPELLLAAMDIRRLGFKAGEVAGIWDNATFHHVPPKAAKQVLEEYHRLLAPEGVLFLRVKRGDGELIEQDSSYPAQRYYKLYQEEDLEELVSSHGFKVIKTDVESESGTATRAARKIEWVYLFARRLAASTDSLTPPSGSLGTGPSTRPSASLRTGLEEGLGLESLLEIEPIKEESPVVGPVLVEPEDPAALPIMAVVHHWQAGTLPPAPPVQGSRVLLTQRGLLPAEVTGWFTDMGWKVDDSLPDQATQQLLLAKVEEWSGQLLVVVGTELEEAVKELPAYGRVTVAVLDPDLARMVPEEDLIMYLLSLVQHRPGRFEAPDQFLRRERDRAVLARQL